MGAATGRADVAAVAALAAAEVLAHRARQPAAPAAARFAACAAGVAIARAAGLSWSDLGLDRKDLGTGVRMGVAAGAGAAVVVFAGVAIPATRGFFLDRRAAPAGGGQLAAQLGRITFVAVPAEELAYRSVLLGLRRRRGLPAGAAAWSSTLFGLSHILPTLATMSQTALHSHLGRQRLRRAAFVGGNVAVTAVAGAGLAWLRLSSGSVVAPMLAHAALNDAALLAGRIAHRRGAGPASPPAPADEGGT